MHDYSEPNIECYMFIKISPQKTKIHIVLFSIVLFIHVYTFSLRCGVWGILALEMAAFFMNMMDLNGAQLVVLKALKRTFEQLNNNVSRIGYSR